MKCIGSSSLWALRSRLRAKQQVPRLVLSRFAPSPSLGMTKLIPAPHSLLLATHYSVLETDAAIPFGLATSITNLPLFNDCSSPCSPGALQTAPISTLPSVLAIFVGVRRCFPT